MVKYWIVILHKKVNLDPKITVLRQTSQKMVLKTHLWQSNVQT